MVVPNNIMMDWINYEISNSSLPMVECCAGLMSLDIASKNLRIVAYLTGVITAKQQEITALQDTSTLVLALQADIDSFNNIILSLSKGP